MTAQDVLVALRRRWYVVLAALLMTAAVAAVIPKQPGVWYTRADVVFLVPNSPKLAGNALEGDNESLINFTAAVERQVNGSAAQIELSSPNATLYGAGVKRGYIITLPNEGGQWNPSFDQSVLRVQVVDSTEQAAGAVAADVISRIQQAATTTQDQLDIPASQRIRTEVNPAVPAVGYVGGSAKRAVAVVVLLGVALSVVAAVEADRRLRRGRPARTRTVAEAGI